MTGILKVDTIQKNDGTAASVADLGVTIGSESLPTGSIVQVVHARSLGTYITTTSTSLTDTGISISITPKYANSDILVQFTFTSTSSSSNNSAAGTQYAIYRNNSTNLITGVNNPGYLEYNWAADYNHSVATISHVDSPATTSATTYSIYFRQITSGPQASLQRDWGGVQMIAMEIAG